MNIVLLETPVVPLVPLVFIAKYLNYSLVKPPYN
jgi:hypothetical protein